MSRYNTISFLSDFGLVDESVGLVKSIVRNGAPNAVVIDISHDIDPYDVRGASLMLVRSAPYLTPGVVIASIGLSKRYIAIEIGDGESVLLGPDNGLFAPVVTLVDGASRVIELKKDNTYRAVLNILCSAAVDLCNGVELRKLGAEIDAHSLVPSMIPFAGVQDGVLQADVLHIDRYGNVQLNVTRELVALLASPLTMITSQQSFNARVVGAITELRDGETGLLFSSDDVGVIVVNQQSAAEFHQLTPEMSLTIQ